jgi:hypothetical protein
MSDEVEAAVEAAIHAATLAMDHDDPLTDVRTAIRAVVKAARIAALRGVPCAGCGAMRGHTSRGKTICGCSISTIRCRRCVLLTEAEGDA